MSEIIILYSTTDGHTRDICKFLHKVIEQPGHQVTLTCIDDDPAVELDTFDKIVIGASIRYGKHSKKCHRIYKREYLVIEAETECFFLS